MATADNADELREEIRRLHARYGNGDVPEKTFNRSLDELTLKLSRSVARARLPEDEVVIHEHHVLHAHFKFNQSVLRETEQEAVSLFVTGRRLLRLRAFTTPGRMPTLDERDGASIEEFLLADVTEIKLVRRPRPGEALAGAIICLVAILFHRWLLITGAFMAALGALGILHALLMPTKWLELETRPGTLSDPVRIYAFRKRRARPFVRFLREHIASGRRGK